MSVDRSSANRPSQPVVAPGSAPKLVISTFASGAVVCIKFVGTIDESFEGKQLGMTAVADTLVLDLGGVKKISSFGIREWVDFVTTASEHARSMILIECTPKVIDQLNMVANFTGGGRVFSFYAPFRCDYCEAEHRVLLQVDRDFEAMRSLRLAERPCLSCKESMYFDEDGATFFSYLLGQERFQLEPAVEAFLASKLDYAVGDLNRKLRVDKVIEGRTTYLRLDGDLDNTFPRDKLAEGVEGTVIVDLGAIGTIDPAGAMEWRDFVGMIAPVVERLYLASAPPTFVEKLCGRDDLNSKVQLLTVLLPYTCASCGTTSAHTVDLGEHHDAVANATAPELRCPQCKRAMQCRAGETVMTLLPAMPRPTAGPDLVKSIGVLRERALAVAAIRKPARAPGSTGLPAPIRTPTSLAVPVIAAVLAAVLAVMLAAAGYLAYQRFESKPVLGGLGTLISRSAAARPAWITGDEPAAATCGDTGKGISCVGVSSISARQDDAEEEAGDAALDALANALAVRIADPAWKQAVPGIYAAARDAKLAAFDRDPGNTSARRDVREARHAVAQALRASGGGAVPAAPSGRYWEEYLSGDGKRFLAFAQVAIGATELAALTGGYAKPAGALGATAVAMFPLIGWRYPRLERGAVIIALASGPLQEVGLAEQYIVIGVGGRDVGDAAAFAKLTEDEYAAVADHGGVMRMKILAGDGAPREFAVAIKSKTDAIPASLNKHQRRPRSGPDSVNVWDRVNGTEGSGRDDPTQ